MGQWALFTRCGPLLLSAVTRSSSGSNHRLHVLTHALLLEPVKQDWWAHDWKRVQFWKLGAGNLEIWRPGNPEMWGPKNQKHKSKFTSFLPKLSVTSGLVGKNPPGPICGHPRPFFPLTGKIQKIWKILPIFLGGPMGPIHPVWALAAIHPRCGNRVYAK